MLLAVDSGIWLVGFTGLLSLLTFKLFNYVAAFLLSAIMLDPRISTGGYAFEI